MKSRSWRCQLRSSPRFFEIYSRRLQLPRWLRCPYWAVPLAPIVERVTFCSAIGLRVSKDGYQWARMLRASAPFLTDACLAANDPCFQVIAQWWPRSAHLTNGYQSPVPRMAKPDCRDNIPPKAAKGPGPSAKSNSWWESELLTIF